MPKVSHMTARILGEHVRFDIHYNKEKSFHLKDFNPEILNLVGTNNRYKEINGFDTEAALVNNIHRIINAYNELASTLRKVIVFSLYASTEIYMVRTGPNSHSGYRPGIDNVRSMRDSCDYAVGFDYAVLMETIGGDGKKYNVIHEDGTLGYSRNLQQHETVIDWTPERQQAFEQLTDGMYQLMVKICAALGDEKKALAFIDSKIKLLAN